MLGNSSTTARFTSPSCGSKMGVVVVNNCDVNVDDCDVNTVVIFVAVVVVVGGGGGGCGTVPRPSMR